jgi:hypothetical protein
LATVVRDETYHKGKADRRTVADSVVFSNPNEALWVGRLCMGAANTTIPMTRP